MGKTLWIEQLKAIGLTLALAIVGTSVIALVIKAVIGLRASKPVEEQGLDDAEHGEAGYHDDEMGHVSTEASMPAAAPVFQPAATPKY